MYFVPNLKLSTENIDRLFVRRIAISEIKMRNSKNRQNSSWL
jgi:hypothetical protein